MSERKLQSVRWPDMENSLVSYTRKLGIVNQLIASVLRFYVPYYNFMF